MCTRTTWCRSVCACICIAGLTMRRRIRETPTSRQGLLQLPQTYLVRTAQPAELPPAHGLWIMQVTVYSMQGTIDLPHLQDTAPGFKLPS